MSQRIENGRPSKDWYELCEPTKWWCENHDGAMGDSTDDDAHWASLRFNRNAAEDLWLQYRDYMKSQGWYNQEFDAPSFFCADHRPNNVSESLVIEAYAQELEYDPYDT